MLDFEEQWPRWSSAKDEAIRVRFDIPPARYFQLLNRLIDTEEALAANPLLVHRLRRRRDDAAAHRQRRAS
ncbi:hypothetical protein AS029_12975 [Microbacterium enclense]|nr:hypothetical protein AS029_12975 [Microbacterium enclense]